MLHKNKVQDNGMTQFGKEGTKIKNAGREKKGGRERSKAGGGREREIPCMCEIPLEEYM